MRNVLITGATGFLGGAALSYILKEKSECQLLLLTRGESTKHAVIRVNENLRKFQLAETLINRISSDNILLGDLTAPDFFLEDCRLNAITDVINCAHITSSGNNPFIWTGYVEGMLRFVDRMSQAPSLRHFLHIESAGLGVSASECGLDNKPGFSNYENAIAQCSWANSLIEQRIIECYPELPLMRIVPSTGIEQTELGNSICRHLNLP